MRPRVVSGCEYLKLKSEAKTIRDEMDLEDTAVDLGLHQRTIDALRSELADKEARLTEAARLLKQLGVDHKIIAEKTGLQID